MSDKWIDIGLERDLDGDGDLGTSAGSQRYSHQGG